MEFDDKYYEEEGKKFSDELKRGAFSLEILENNGPDQQEKEAADLVAFDAYLQSADFKLFREEVFEKDEVSTE
jgi:hypothetical protein